MEFNLTYILILGTHHPDKEPQKEFYYRGSYWYLKCHHDYAESLVEIFDNQIQSEYHGGNAWLYI